jgi:hypothetical protein
LAGTKSALIKLAGTLFAVSLSFLQLACADVHTEKARTLFPGLKVYSSGIFYGHISFLDPQQQAIVVTPIDKSLPRYQFHLDRKTVFRIEKKKVPYSKLALGNKVAVRYFAENRRAIADEVFVVAGEFVPKDYLKKIKVKTKKEEGEGAAEKEGGHGGEKKEGGH